MQDVTNRANAMAFRCLCLTRALPIACVEHNKQVTINIYTWYFCVSFEHRPKSRCQVSYRNNNNRQLHRAQLKCSPLLYIVKCKLFHYVCIKTVSHRLILSTADIVNRSVVSVGLWLLFCAASFRLVASRNFCAITSSVIDQLWCFTRIFD